MNKNDKRRLAICEKVFGDVLDAISFFGLVKKVHHSKFKLCIFTFYTVSKIKRLRFCIVLIWPVFG